MWLAGLDPSTVANPWGVLAVVFMATASLGGIWLRARLSKPENVAVRAAEPVARQSAVDAAAETKTYLQESVIEPLQADLAREQVLRREAENRADRAEREADAQVRRAQLVAANRIADNERLIGENAVLKQQRDTLQQRVSELEGRRPR